LFFSFEYIGDIIFNNLFDLNRLFITSENNLEGFEYEILAYREGGADGRLRLYRSLLSAGGIYSLFLTVFFGFPDRNSVGVGSGNNPSAKR
jgi:hypothetical protein